MKKKTKFAIRDAEGCILSVFEAASLAEATHVKDQVEQLCHAPSGRFLLNKAPRQDLRDFKAAGVDSVVVCRPFPGAKR
jgi:hypothetical protein